MLKFFFYVLLAANGFLFAFGQGYLDTFMPSGREPARVANQLNADKIKLVSPAVANAPPVAPAPAVAAVAEPEPAAPPPERKQNLIACTEIGYFNSAEARRFEAQLTAVALGGQFSRREIQEPGSYMVLIPPQDGKEGADKRAGELRQSGVTDFYIIQDSEDLRWGISLGVFKSEDAARVQLAAVNQKGVRGARLAVYKAPSSKIAFQLRGLDSDEKGNLDKVRADFPRQELRRCE